MKKLVYIASAVLLVSALAGCAQNEKAQAIETKTHVSLTAGIAGNDGTRTDFSDPAAPKWSSNDAIGVHFTQTDIIDNHYRLTSELRDGGNTATFSGDVNLAEGQYTIYGYYPHGEFGEETNNYATAKIEVPAVQRPTATSFDPAADVMVMLPITHNHNGEDIVHDGLQFKRVLGMLKFILDSEELNGEAIQNLTFTTDAGIELAGLGNFDLAEGTFVEFYEGETTVAAKPENVYANGTDAIMLCVPAVNIPSGTTLTIMGETEGFTFKKTKTLEGDITLEAGNWHTMNITLAGSDITTKASAPQAPAEAKTTNIWEVAVAGGIQFWSDVINMPACNKDTFNSYSADCRNNWEPNGYYYSWWYVRDNGAALCPAPWSVPTVDDFVALDIALGGIGSYQIDNALRGEYTGSRWGGQYGGYVNNRNPESVDIQGNYWSRSVNPDAPITYPANGSYGENIYVMQITSSSGVVDPMSYGYIGRGYNVRCVINS